MRNNLLGVNVISLENGVLHKVRTCNHFAAPPQEIAVDLEDDDYESDESAEIV